MKSLFCFLLLLISVFASAYAQNKDREDRLFIDDVPKRKLPDDTFSGKINDQLSNPFSFEKEFANPDFLNKTFAQNKKTLNYLSNVSVLDIYNYKHYYKRFQPAHAPMLEDFQEGKYYSLAPGLSMNLSSSSETYIGLGNIKMSSANFIYKPTDWLTLNGGAYASKYSFGNAHYNDMGINASFNVKLNEHFSINGFGQYSAFGARNHIGSPVMNIYPTSYYGATIEYKPQKNFGIDGGFVRQRNPMNGKWENQLIIAPFVIFH